MTRDEIMAAVQTILSEQMMHPHLEGFGPLARLNEDLYLDSVLILQIFLNLELEYGLAMPEKAISQQDVVTVEDLAGLFDPEAVDPASAVQTVPAFVGEGVHGEAAYDIKVHCFVSCVCEAVKRAGLDHRPFYFGVWDAKFAVTDRWQLRYHAADISQEFFRGWFERLYAVSVREWYDPAMTKIENLAVLLDLVETRPETGYVMVMLDMFHLPERENKFNQNPFPHYLMLAKTEDPQNWFVLDPDYRWQGDIARDKVIHAILQPTVGGGYVFDRAEARAPQDEDLRAYFDACFVSDRNPLLDSLREIVAAHVEERDGTRLADLDLALRELPVITIRKYAYEHGFAFFWRALKLPAAEFDVWCDDIEALVNALKALQYAAMKLAQTGDRAFLPPVLAHLDQCDRLETRVKGKLAEIFALWCEQQFPAAMEQPQSRRAAR
ncbi:DUF6005 family protein [Pararhizobium antarcticum]|uniref:Phosphopantetheine-binding protein n=1 Tax=Pararhizobium antarcticum TaxID=1798805 RepID=A0A657LYJ1_9HYPH|nr:DUF6005 family protein [Pararhizobium antarcticum]OJG00092.1 phosphopantetheine-binding protein [Rhizobium sp. 58]OJG01505.1 phosphopantetheine-binding protein [Pararhizobium antarcticum]